jgi:hypothetical protein
VVRVSGALVAPAPIALVASRSMGLAAPALAHDKEIAAGAQRVE